MHSREPDLIDAQKLVESYVRFGNAADAIPEFSRPVLIAVVAEAMSIARKEEYAVMSHIDEVCSRSSPATDRLELVAALCRERLKTLADIVHEPASAGDHEEPGIGRFPARHRVAGPFSAFADRQAHCGSNQDETLTVRERIAGGADSQR